MYATDWMYGTRMLVLDIRMWPRGDVPGLGLTDEDIGLLRGVDCDILACNLMGTFVQDHHRVLLVQSGALMNLQ
jgi:hypothetical protein